MSKLDLSIEFGRPERVYAPGEIVTGDVIVSANKDVDCRDLVLSHRWETHGKGNKHKDKETTHSLFTGPWRAGETYRYAFQFPAPEGPPTYHGRHLNIDHYVVVRADIPWSIDAKAREDWLLAPNPEALSAPRAENADFVEKCFRPLSTRTMWWGIVLLVVLGCVPVAFLCFAIFKGVQGVPGLAMGQIVAIILPFSLLVVGAGVYIAKSRRMFAEIVMRLTPRHLRPGETLDLRMQGATLKPLKAERITATLRGAEICVSGSGTNQVTHVHKLHEQDIELARDVHLSPSEAFHYVCLLEIPATNGYSFRAPDNKLVWSVEVRFHVPRSPDWKRELEFIVTPDPTGDLAREKARVLP